MEAAGNGREALDKLHAGIKPNLILTDINMPVMGGMELIRNVRALPTLKFVPILTLDDGEPGREAQRGQAGRSERAGWWEAGFGQRPDRREKMRKILLPEELKRMAMGRDGSASGIHFRKSCSDWK